MPLVAPKKRFEVHRHTHRGKTQFFLWDSRFSRYVNLVWHGDEGREKAHKEAARLELWAKLSRPVLPMC